MFQDAVKLSAMNTMGYWYLLATIWHSQKPLGD
jgi:hypothetical protein